MRAIKLYIATSLDHYIARPNGSVDWLESFPNPDGNDYGYQNFLASIDTTLMGHNTYKEILGFDIPFPYLDKKNYVFTRSHDVVKAAFVEFVNKDIISFIQSLKQQAGKDIWLIGGGQLNTILLNADLIDEMIITIVPIILGEGIPLFAPGTKECIFQLIHSQAFPSGMVQMSYKLG